MQSQTTHHVTSSTGSRASSASRRPFLLSSFWETPLGVDTEKCRWFEGEEGYQAMLAPLKITTGTSYLTSPGGRQNFYVRDHFWSSARVTRVDWEIQYEVEDRWVFSGLIERVPGIVTMRSCPGTSSADVHSSGHSGSSFRCLGGFEGCLGVPCLCFLRGGGESNAAIVVVIIWYLTSCNYSNDMLGIEQYSGNVDSDDDSRQVFNQPTQTTSTLASVCEAKAT
ncbi:hypothetical protein EDD15DRAFT_2199342 [Pisolithus albus]|nr:hypothetical protein EDD15DRAFT_2199342 [Pisolithus albus]